MIGNLLFHSPLQPVSDRGGSFGRWIGLKSLGMITNRHSSLVMDGVLLLIREPSLFLYRNKKGLERDAMNETEDSDKILEVRQCTKKKKNAGLIN